MDDHAVSKLLHQVIANGARVESGVNRLLERSMTHADGARILKEIKSLRDELLKPAFVITVGKPKDKEIVK